MQPFATWFLYGVSAVFLVAIALPLLFAPLAWARAFGWTIPDRADLAVYFARCLGAAALALLYGMVCAARDPALQPLIFEMATLAAALLCAVHVAGAAQKAQPLPETLEIPIYAALALACAWIRSRL
jgi:hypothetical protein